MASSPLYDAALDLTEKQGFSVIPLRPNDKTPLLAWQEFQTRRPTENELEEWFVHCWPQANLGIVTGSFSGLVVVDADGDMGLAWMKEHLPVTGVYVRTGKGWHGYFRHPGGDVRNRGRIAPEVDIRADGGYVVAPPSVHASGANYEWQFTPGLDGWNSLAEYQLKEGAKADSSLACTGFDLSRVNTLLTSAPVEPGQRNVTLARLAGQWLAQGMGQENCLFAALGWNSTLSSPLPPEEVRRTVDSVCRAEVRNHPTRTAPPSVEPLDAMQDDTGWPEHLLHPGGLLESLMTYTVKASAVSHPVFALAGAVAAVGTLAGQKWMTETGLRTNVYCLALGYSGAGKDSPQAALPQIFQRSRAAECLGGNALTSDAALLRYLQTEGKARSLFLLDEIGLLLTAMKRPGSYAAEIPSLLMKLFSGTDRGFSKHYANNANDVDVRWHHLSLYGASTPDRFWDSLTRGEATDGFLARCLVFESRHEVERPRARTDVTVPASLLDAVNALADFVPPVTIAEGNLRPVPAPVVITKTEVAERAFYQWADRYHELRNAHLRDNEGLSSIYGRAAEHAHKLALIHAVSLRGAEPEAVDAEDVSWGCALVDQVVGNLALRIEENIAENEFHKLELRTLKIIRTFAPRFKGVCPHWRIVSSLKGATPKQIEDVLAKLRSSGEIIDVAPSGHGNKKNGYQLARVSEES